MTDLPIAVRPWYRKMRFLLPIGTFVVALGFHLFLSHYEEQRWQNLLKDMKADGEELDFFALFPAVPDEQNFGAIDLLDGIADAEFQKTPEWQQRLIQLNQLCFDTAKVDSSLPLKRPASSDLTSRRKWQAQEWAAFHREQKIFPMPPPSGDDAKDLLTAMSAAEPFIKQMVQALDRPLTRLTPPWRERTINGPIVGHSNGNISLLTYMQRFFGTHSEAALAAGDIQAAVDDIRLMLRLAELAGSDGRMLDGLITSTHLSVTLNHLWSVLESQRCNVGHLTQINESLRRIKASSMLLRCKRGELAAFLNLHSQDESIRAAPNWFQRSKMTDSVARTWQHSIQPLRAQGLEDCLKAEQHEVDEIRQQSWIRRFKMFDYDKTFRATTGITMGFAATSVRLDQALMACALEQYHLQHKTYPDHLTQLVPSHLPSIPTDLYDGKPMRYAPSKTGRYRLWSIGPDGIDNGGIETNPDPSPLKTSKDLGDLIWSYEPPLEAEE